MKKIGIIGVPGGWSSEKLADKAEELTGFRLLIDPEYIKYNSSLNTVTFKGIDLMTLDAVIIKKVGPRYSPDLLNRLELLLFLEKRGLKFYSKVSSIINSFNRLSGTLNLRLSGIPMPPTVITEDVDEAVQIVKEFKKAVFKPLFSTKASGMIVLSDNDENLRDEVEKFKRSGNNSLYIQKMIDIPGKDLGVVFLGGKYLATYARVGNSDSWNTTIHSGGKYQPFEPDDEIVELADKAQKAFNLDFTSVDVVETGEGPMVFEVSAFGGFRGLLESRGIDAAEKYISYVLKNKHDN
jgi:ribosomal protein S6--L-glutamate ligase